MSRIAGQGDARGGARGPGKAGTPAGWRIIGRGRLLVGALLALALGACTRPPPEAYVSGSTRASAGTPAGADAKGEACLQQPGARPPTDMPVALSHEVFCGGWTQPAARVIRMRGPTDAANLDALAQGGLWRTWLEQRVTCSPPQATTIAGGTPARLLACTRR